MTPSPLFLKAALLLEKEQAKRQRAVERQKASRQKQKTEYGARNGTAKWGTTKRAVALRFHGRCLFAGTSRCSTPQLGLVVHHWQRTVGAGGDNSPEGLALLCSFCHAAAHDGHLSRADIRARLVVLGHIAPEGQA